MSSIKNALLKQGLTLIPISEIEIKLDSDKTTAYDLTVDDNFTFSTDDGIYLQDTMAIFHPLSNESQKEARENMMSILGGTNSTQLNFKFTKEMLAGLYILTKDGNSKKSPLSVITKDLQEITDPFIAVKYRGYNTTSGRAIYNSCFPQDFPYYNGQITGKILDEMILKAVDKYDQIMVGKIASKINKISFKWATIMAPSFTIDQLELPPKIYKIKEKLKNSTPEEADKLLKEAQVIVKDHIKNTGFGDLAESGASKGIGQIMQILVAKGIIADPQGNILSPIEGSFTDGLNNIDYFNASSGARKGIIDRVINTAQTGYFSRKLAFLLNSVEIHLSLKDCKTKRTLSVKLTSDLINRFTGRFIVNNKGQIEEFIKNDHKEGELIELRSPIFCRSPKLCWICYGKLYARHRSPYAGVISAQAIGEVGTQMIMKTFHSGGSVSLLKRDMLDDIVNGDPMSGLKK